MQEPLTKRPYVPGDKIGSSSHTSGGGSCLVVIPVEGHNELSVDLFHNLRGSFINHPRRAVLACTCADPGPQLSTFHDWVAWIRLPRAKRRCPFKREMRQGPSSWKNYEGACRMHSRLSMPVILWYQQTSREEAKTQGTYQRCLRQAAA